MPDAMLTLPAVAGENFRRLDATPFLPRISLRMFLRKVDAQPYAYGSDARKKHNKTGVTSARYFLDPEQDVTDDQIK